MANNNGIETTPEVHFAQQLASNQKNVNEKALKKVGKWLEAKSSAPEGAFTEDGMLKLWKGIFYYFWNLDKPLIQEDRASVISKNIHCFKMQKYSLLYIDTFFQTMAREWPGIDKYRLEKFMMFVRKFLRECFVFLKQTNWKVEIIKQFRNILKSTVASADDSACSLGLKFHVIDIFMEELTRVGSEELTPQKVKQFVLVFCSILAYSENASLLKAVKNNIFMYLLNQDVDEEVYGEFPTLKFDPVLIQNLVKKWSQLDGLKKVNVKYMLSIIKRFEKPDEPTVNNEEIEMLKKKKAPLIRKKLIEKSRQDLLKEDEQFRCEKLMWKKEKNKKRKRKDISSDDEMYLE